MTELEKITLMECYNHHNGKFPKELDASGVMFWRGQRITKADFRAIKRDGIQSERFNK